MCLRVFPVIQVYDLTSLLFQRRSFGKHCCHKKKNRLLSKCLLVLDKVNEVSARDGKLFLQEAGVQRRVKGVDGLSSSSE